MAQLTTEQEKIKERNMQKIGVYAKDFYELFGKFGLSTNQIAMLGYILLAVGAVMGVKFGMDAITAGQDMASFCYSTCDSNEVATPSSWFAVGVILAVFGLFIAKLKPYVLKLGNKSVKKEQNNDK